MKTTRAIILFLFLGGWTPTWTPTWAATPPDQHPIKQGDPGGCAIKYLAGQITEIDGPGDQMVLMRGGRRLTIVKDRCVRVGDTLKVGPDALVRVSTASGPRVFGGAGEAPVWAPRTGEATGTADVLEALQRAFGGLFGTQPPRREYAVSRDTGVCGKGVEPDGNLSAVSRLPVAPQRLGADLTQISIAWAPVGLRARVSLTDPSGAEIAEAETCGGAVATLPLPDGGPRPGDRFTLTIEDNRGGILRYPITVVTPASLKSPPGPMDDWVLGAWRLSSDDQALKLDALSRLGRGADKSYVGHRILEAVAADEPIAKAPAPR
jgi:hypothetical protein